MDASNLTFPVFVVISIVGAFGTLVVWIFGTFERKEDSNSRHASLEERVAHHEILLQNVARDVSYIRGRIEIKNDKT